jgi:nitrate reductase assembly molybdenum cofactor insertion protein NarJ
MVIDQRQGDSPSEAFLLLLSSLVTRRPDKEAIQAMDLTFRGDEGEEFSKLFKIPCGRFVPPYLAAHQNIDAPQIFMSKLMGLYRKGGFMFEQNSGERPDHAGVVLEFMALMRSEGKNPTDELEALITDPLKRFSKALRKATEHPLYKKVADALAEMSKKEMFPGEQERNLGK